MKTKNVKGKKVLALLCSAGLLSSLLMSCAAMGASSTATSAATPASVPQPASAASVDKFGKYDPPIVVTSVRSVSDENTFPPGDDIENNVYTRMLKDELGIIIKYDWVVDSSQWDTKVAMMLASGSMPDFFQATPADFMNLSQQDAVMDLTEVYDTYASDLLKKHDSNFREGYESGFINGKHYGVANLGWGIISMPNVLWIRQDWLAESGKEAPKTLEELEALAKQFMESHPGTYGIALDKSLTNSINTITGITNAFHAYNKIWIEKDNTIEYSSIQPEMKNALQYLQNLYKEGIIDKEFAVKDTNKVIEDITNGKVGIVYGGNNIGFWGTYNAVKNDANAAFMPFDLPKNDDETLYLQARFPVSSYVVVNKNMEHPEAVIKMINLFSERFADGTFNKPEFKETVMWSYPPAVQTDPMNEYEAYKNVSHALTTKDESVLSPQQMPFYTAAKKWQDDKDAVTDTTSYGRYVQMGPDGAYSILAKYVDENRILLSKMRGVEPPGYAKVSSTLEKLEDDTFTKIIMGESIDSFDKFVEEWKKLGGDSATQEMNDMYNK